MGVEALPPELALRIFLALSAPDVARASQACKAWLIIGRQQDLWQHLFVAAWGKDVAAQKLPSLQQTGSWRLVYEVYARQERLGNETCIVREGSAFYLVSKGEKLRHLATAAGGDHLSSSDEPSDTPLNQCLPPELASAPAAVRGATDNRISTPGKASAATATVAFVPCLSRKRRRSLGACSPSFKTKAGGAFERMVAFLGDLKQATTRALH